MAVSKVRKVVLIDGVVFENVNQIGIWRMFYEVLDRLSSDFDFRLLVNSPACSIGTKKCKGIPPMPKASV